MNEASELIVDVDDVPIVALALAVHNEGVWTYDKKHFHTEKLQSRIKVLTTTEVIKKYPLEEN